MLHYVRFLGPDGNATFSMHKVDEIQHGEGIHIYFECEGLDEKVAVLTGKGIQFDKKPTDRSWLWREARLKDLDDNQLILFYARENRINLPWKIKS